VLKLLPDNALAHYNRGKARSQLGQRDLATADFKRAVELNPILANAK
jgi:lipoprotein NlpI